MLKKIINNLNNSQALIVKIVIFVALALFINLLCFNFKVIVAPYPHEYREGAIVLTTSQLLNHVNPYLLSEQPQHTDVYGVLYNLVVYPLATFFGPTLTVHRAISALFIFLSCAWLIFILRKEGIPGWLSFIGGVIYYAEITSLFSVVARPDSLGVFLFLSAIFLPWLGKFKWRYLVLSTIFFILAFYTKLYFTISLPIVALYIFLFKDKIKAFLFFTFSLLLLLSSAIIVNLYFPIYLTNTFYYYFGVGGSLLGGLWHVARQFAFFSYKNFGLVFVFIILVIELIRENKNGLVNYGINYLKILFRSLKKLKTDEIKFDYIVFVFILTSAAFILKFGQNTGGFVDYMYHLITPFMIIIVFRFLAKKISNKKFAIFGLLLIFGMIFTFVNHHRAIDYSSQWKDINNKLSGYKNIFNEPATTAVLLSQNKFVYDSGHSNGYLGNGMQKSPLYPAINERLREYNSDVEGQVINKKFDLIVMDNYSYNMLSRDLLSQNYYLKSTMPAPMMLGNFILELWAPKPTITK